MDERTDPALVRYAEAARRVDAGDRRLRQRR